VGEHRLSRTRQIQADDDERGNFCDPFGICPDALPQIEIAAGGIVRF
jgi:hypothetical protein